MSADYVAILLFIKLSAGRRDRTAIITNDSLWSYQQIAELSCQVGNALSQLGVERENRVALLLVDGPELVASFFGATAIGAIPIPLNTSLLASDLHFLLNHSRAKVLIVDGALFHLIDNIRRSCPHLRRAITVGEKKPNPLP